MEILNPNKISPVKWWRKFWSHSSFLVSLGVKDLKPACALQAPNSPLKPQQLQMWQLGKRNDPMFAAYTQTVTAGQWGKSAFYSWNWKGRWGWRQRRDVPDGKAAREEYLAWGAQWPNSLGGRLWLNGSGMTWNKAEGSFNSILKFLESHKDRARTAGSTHRDSDWIGKSWILRKFFAQTVLAVWRGRGHWARGGSRPGKEELKIAEYNIKEHLAKGKGKRKEMGSGNESGGRKERTNGKKSGLIKEGQALK